MAITKKRKKFFEVDIPLIRKQTQLYAFDIKELEGRDIKYDLTRILKGKNILLRLKVSVEKDNAIAVPMEINLLSSLLQRVVRKGTDYVEDSFSAECKDAQLRIKPLFVTRARVSRQIKKALREKAKEELMKAIKSEDSEKVFEDVLRGKIQKELSLKLKKIYPLSFCEIRILKVEKFLENSSKDDTAVPKKEGEKEIRTKKEKIKEDTENIFEEESQEASEDLKKSSEEELKE